MPRISETNNNTELNNQALAAGITGSEHPIFNDQLDGTYIIADFDVLLYDNPVHEGQLKKYTITGGLQPALTPNVVTYLVVKYNGGSPILDHLTFAQLSQINESDVIPIYSMFNENNDIIHALDWDMVGQGVANKLHTRFVKTQRFQRQGGLELTVTNPARSIQLSSGIIWAGGNSHILNDADSSNGDVPACICSFTGGTGYTDGEYTNVSTSYGGAGVGLTVDIRVEGGSVTKAEINTPGSGYTTRDVVTITGGTATATIVPDRFGFWHNTGAGGTVTALDTGGDGILVDPVSIGAAGTGYHVGDILSITGGGGTGATVSIDSVNATGGILTASIVDGGTGYTGGILTEPLYQGWYFDVVEDGTGVYGNTYYDGGDGVGLVPLPAGTFAVNWIYRDIEHAGHMGRVYCAQPYNTYAEAAGSRPRTDLPAEFGVLGMLVGRIIVEQGQTDGIAESAFADVTLEGFVQAHSGLAGLQGGQTDEYFHLSSAQYQHNDAGFPVSLSSFMNEIGNNTEHDVHGALDVLASTQTLNSGADITGINKGTGKIFLALLAGADFTGEIRVIGDSVDRNTGVVLDDGVAEITVGAPGSGYTNGTYLGVTGTGAGTDILVDVTVAGGIVTLAQPVENNVGTGWTATDVITISDAAIGGGTGATFSVATAGDVDVIAVDVLTVETSGTDTNGVNIWDFTDGYLTDRWFKNVVKITTEDTSFTDIDVYHVSYEQFNDEPNVILDTFDINIRKTNTGYFSAHLYVIQNNDLGVTQKFDIYDAVDEVGKQRLLYASGDVNEWYRLRAGQLGITLNCNRDGVWVETFFTGTNAHEECGIKVWGRILPEV
jgi:hypothetical protein